MGICAECQHFRRARALSQLLAAQFTTNDADVAKELKSLQDEERKLRDTEAESMRMQASMGKPSFLARPRMTDFCAFQESGGVYLIAELKNAGAACADFKGGARPRRSCADCAHNVKPEGRERDARKERLFASLKVSAIGTKSSTSEAESLMSSHRQNVTSGKAFEISSVALNRGELPAPPDYLDYCKSFSTEGNFVVGLFKNPFNDCGKWEAIVIPNIINPAPAQPGAAAPTAGPAPVAAPPLAPPPMGIPLGQMAGGAPAGADSAMCAQLVAALEWLLDVAIPPQLRALMQKEMTDTLSKNDQTEIEGLMKLIQLHQGLLPQPPEVRTAVREMHQPEIVAALRAGPDQVNRMLVALYDAANAPIAQGNPPLTREMANCYLDLIGFVQSLAMNAEWHPLPEAMRGQQIQMLSVQYPFMPPQQQAWFAGLPLGWTQLRASWVTAPPETRSQLRLQILASMGVQPQDMYTPPPPPFAQGPYGAPPYQQPYQQQYQQPYQQQYQQPYQQAYQPSPQAYGTPPDQGKTSDDLVKEILDDDKKKEAEAAKESPELALQVRLQNSARNAQMMSNMMQMRFDSMMTVARNIK